MSPSCSPKASSQQHYDVLPPLARVGINYKAAKRTKGPFWQLHWNGYDPHQPRSAASLSLAQVIQTATLTQHFPHAGHSPRWQWLQQLKKLTSTQNCFPNIATKMVQILPTLFGVGQWSCQTVCFEPRFSWLYRQLQLGELEDRLWRRPIAPFSLRTGEFAQQPTYQTTNPPTQHRVQCKINNVIIGHNIVGPCIY